MRSVLPNEYAAKARGIVLSTIAVGAVYVVQHAREAPEPVALTNPCDPRPLPGAGGLTGLLQDEALKLLDRAACQAGAPREALALALFDERRAKQFQRQYGVDPRSVAGLLSLLGG